VADVFLSYSRRDSAFVRRLVAALENQGKDVWIDVDGIRDAEVFPDALRRAVESSDAFVFVITEDSVHSAFCKEEVQHAAALNKRIVPLARAPVDDAEIPPEVRFRNWIPATQESEFESAVDRIIVALDTDLEWEREHSRLTVKALEWEQSGRDRSFLLRGADLAAAERWLAAGAGKDPGPSALEGKYLATARAAATRRQRNLVAASLGVAAVSIALLVFALISRSDAINARDSARAQALTSDAERVGAQALTDPNVDHSLLLAVAGVELQNRVETRSDLLADLQQNAALIRVIRPSDVEIAALRVSPDGRLLAVADSSGAVRFIDLSSWRQIGAALQLHDPIAERALSFSPDGRTLMALTNGAERSELYAIDVSRHRARIIETWSGPTPFPPIGFQAVAYSPDGRRVAVTHETEPGDANIPEASRLVMLDMPSGRVLWQRRYPLRPGQADPHAVFTPTGELLTSAQQGYTLLWDPRTGRILRRFPRGGLPAIAPDGHTVALGQNSPSAGDQSAVVTLLDLRTGGHRTLLANLPDHWIRSLAFTPDGTELAGAATDGMHLWDLATGKILESYVAGAGPRSLSTLDPTNDTLISGQQDGSITAFDLAGERRLGRAFTWNTPDLACAYSPCMAVNRQSQLMATTQFDGTVAIVDLRTLRLTRTLPARDGTTVAAIAFMPDGRTLVTGGINGRATFWDADTGRVTRTLRFGAPVWWTAPSPDGKLLAVQTAPADGSDNAVEVVQIATGKVLQSHAVGHGPSGVEFSRDGRELVALGCCWIGTASRLVAWDVGTGRQLFSRSDLEAGAFAVAPDSRLLGVGTGSGQVLLLGARSGQESAAPIQVGAGEISSISFSPDGRTFAVSSNDHTASVWDLRSRVRLGNAFGPYAGTIPTTLFEPSGRLLISLFSDGVEWPMDVGTWERFACRVAGRDLTPTEWHDLVPDRPYRRVCPG